MAKICNEFRAEILGNVIVICSFVAGIGNHPLELLAGDTL
jgi:hypothetical protein